MLKKVLAALAVILAVFLVVVSMRPANYEIKRATNIAAPAEVAYGYLVDMNNFSAWSPWAKLDPNMKTTVEGSGAGSAYSWEGNDDVGAGRMTIVGVKPNESIVIKLEFLKPWESTSTTEWRLTPSDDATTVTWSMAGENDFMGKMMTLFMDMDAMVGKDFEAGLATLKTNVEAESKKIAEAKAAAEKAAAEAAAAAAAAAGDGAQ
ncbi:SRPBCC family protein, partial [Myxococcota bacterium]|nr:SRPBCC family protein [Myxococcota bacterium]